MTQELALFISPMVWLPYIPMSEPSRTGCFNAVPMLSAFNVPGGVSGVEPSRVMAAMAAVPTSPVAAPSYSGYQGSAQAYKFSGICHAPAKHLVPLIRVF